MTAADIASFVLAALVLVVLSVCVARRIRTDRARDAQPAEEPPDA